MIQIGDKVRFTPTANTDHSAGFPDVLAVEVEGTVVQINEEHRWYRVRCELPTGYIFHECFPHPDRGDGARTRPRLQALFRGRLAPHGAGLRQQVSTLITGVQAG